MCARPRGRLLRATSLVAAGASVLLVAGATPAAAHAVDSGSMPAPPWLLAYLGVFAVLATALALRFGWRPLTPATAPAEVATRRPRPVGPGPLLGVVLYGLVLGAAVVGPDSPASNIAPVAVLVVWWVGVPLLSLLVGDVMRAINPFVAVVALLERGRDRSAAGDAAPTWVPAALLGGFAWFFVAYHQPGSPRAVAMLLAVYAVAAVAAGLRWGSRWLATGEGFGALSAAVSTVAPIRRSPLPPGAAAVIVVWLGSVAFDGFATTSFWEDVLADSRGWGRTAFNTVGYAWVTAVVAAVHLAAVRLAGPRDERADDRGLDHALALALGAALVPLALGWFVGHDLTLLLFEGQNFLALLHDPIGRGWDLMPAFEPDYGLPEAGWVPWVQVLAVLGGHVAAVVVAHAVARRLRPGRAAMRATWWFTAAAAVSTAAAALLVLG